MAKIDIRMVRVLNGVTLTRPKRAKMTIPGIKTENALIIPRAVK